MRIKKYLASILVGLILLTNLSACTVVDLLIDNSSEIPYKPYTNQASSTEEIIQSIIDAVENNADQCKLFITDASLIDANAWLAQISGIEQIQCDYRRIKDGYNMIISYKRWDNYYIVNAYKNKDTSSLNQRQLEMYNKYITILDTVTSPNNSDYENELAIHDYLVENIEYEETDDKLFNAYHAVIEGKAVCSGYTECFKTLMDMLGIENTTVSGVAGSQQHIWNMVKLDNEWYQVDVTWDDPVGSTSPYISHAYFNVTDEDMAVDHIWNEALHPHRATNKSYSYITRAGLKTINNQTELNNYLYSVVKSGSSHVEYAATGDFDLKSAISSAGIILKYSYKATKRADYTLYSVTFSY